MVPYKIKQEWYMFYNVCFYNTSGCVFGSHPAIKSESFQRFEYKRTVYLTLQVRLMSTRNLRYLNVTWSSDRLNTVKVISRYPYLLYQYSSLKTHRDFRRSFERDKNPIITKGCPDTFKEQHLQIVTWHCLSSILWCSLQLLIEHISNEIFIKRQYIPCCWYCKKTLGIVLSGSSVRMIPFYK